MSWLLDTHVWVWSQLEPERLGPETVALLEDPAEALYISTMSTLEVARLCEGGRLEFTVGVEEWTAASLELLSALTLELTHEVAAEAYRLFPLRSTGTRPTEYWSRRPGATTSPFSPQMGEFSITLTCDPETLPVEDPRLTLRAPP